MSSRAAGDVAERRAALFLESLGYKILHRNYTCRMGEIDLVCEQEGTLCFVEVRMRTIDRFGAAIETLTPQKLRRISLTARHYLMKFHLDERACRFDVVTIQGDKEPELAKDAFHADY